MVGAIAAYSSASVRGVNIFRSILEPIDAESQTPALFHWVPRDNHLLSAFSNHWRNPAEFGYFYCPITTFVMISAPRLCTTTH